MRQKIISLLKQSDEPLSGEVLAKELGVTRTAVWKQVKVLQEMGYSIVPSGRKGYVLKDDPKIINQVECDLLVDDLQRDIDAYFFESVDSTNAFGKTMERESLIVALEQTAGRGRLGRTWESEKGQGLYFSLVLFPTLPLDVISMITQLSGLALQRVLPGSQIKWPNDVYIRGKKVAGILTELQAESFMLQRLIVGVGVNRKTPKGFKDLATGVEDEDCNITMKGLLSAFLREFFSLYEEFIKVGDLSFLLEELEAVSYLKGKEVVAGSLEGSYRFVGIDSRGNAILEDSYKNKSLVHFGEISKIRER